MPGGTINIAIHSIFIMMCLRVMCICAKYEEKHFSKKRYVHLLTHLQGCKQDTTYMCLTGKINNNNNH